MGRGGSRWGLGSGTEEQLGLGLRAETSGQVWQGQLWHPCVPWCDGQSGGTVSELPCALLCFWGRGAKKLLLVPRSSLVVIGKLVALL